MEQKLLYSIRELFDKFIKGKVYVIPAYQRGYKWETEDITRLLDDVYEFNYSEELNLFYCLQNITITETDEGFNVVDGQQRLTTLAIILSYLGEYEMIKNKIVYKVRKQTEEFINQFIYNPGNIDDFSDWQEFLCSMKSENKDFDYQDIYYIYKAYKAVSNWFGCHLEIKEELKNRILDNVKMIVNLPRNVEEQELFENLNGKRVPLDGADLIRALIITRVAKREVRDIENSIKQNILINERRIRIGLTIDTINLWWSQDNNRKNYFKYFIKQIKTVKNNNIKFDEETYPINFLYKLYVCACCNSELSIDLFERKSTEVGFLKELLVFQRTIENWYEDKELYHLILFTAVYCGKTIGDLYKNWQEKTKSEFVKYLISEIAGCKIYKELINQNDYSQEEHEKIAFEENWYENESNQLVSVSILLDIVANLMSPLNVKLPALNFRVYEEDFEHIFPQTPIGDRVKDKTKQTQILKQYIDIINQISTNGRIELKDEDIDWENYEWKEKIKGEINSKLMSIIPINSLGNMCLLHRSVNRGYGNDFFLEKRIDIMRKSREGYFIRPHVYDAFNKVFVERKDDSIDMQMMLRWDKKDIIQRRRYIISKISNFLNSNEK